MTRLIHAVQARMAVDPQFHRQVMDALNAGGLPAAASVVRRHGIDLPASGAPDGELSDLELEMVAGGKSAAYSLYNLGMGGVLFGMVLAGQIHY